MSNQVTIMAQFSGGGVNERGSVACLSIVATVKVPFPGKKVRINFKENCSTIQLDTRALLASRSPTCVIIITPRFITFI